MLAVLLLDLDLGFLNSHRKEIKQGIGIKNPSVFAFFLLRDIFHAVHPSIEFKLYQSESDPNVKILELSAVDYDTQELQRVLADCAPSDWRIV